MVDLEVDQGLAVITIDRPHARNAIAPATMGELDKALDAVADARALVIKGAGDKAFVSGGRPEGTGRDPHRGRGAGHGPQDAGYLRPARLLPRPGDRRAERSRVRWRRRSRGVRRHPRRRRRHPDRLQPDGPGDHARVGRRRTARRTRRQGPGTAAHAAPEPCWTRRRPSASDWWTEYCHGPPSRRAGVRWPARSPPARRRRSSGSWRET